MKIGALIPYFLLTRHFWTFTDVPDNAVVVGSPAKIVSIKTNK